MRRVIVNMSSFIFTDAIRRALLDDGDFNISVVNDPQKVAEEGQLLAANLVLLEVNGHALWNLEERLKIRDELKKQVPDCKIVLLVDEKADQALACRVKQLCQDGMIDLFFYASTSTSYLAALLDTI